MKQIFLSVFLFIGSAVISQSLYFPPVSGDTWETLSPESLGWCTENIEPLYDYLETTNTKAFLVLKDGKMVLEKYFGTFTQDSIWYWASAGKTLTAFMVGMAQEQGYLSISDTTSAYLGEGWTDCTPEQEEKITIRHQLTMTSGLDDYVPDNHCTLDTCLQYEADAGNRWAYHNAPYTLLDSVLQTSTGQTLNSFVFTDLSIYTGIYGLYLTIDYDHVFFSLPRAMARFGLLMLNKGNWDGTEILSDTEYLHDMTNTSQDLNLSYGYLTWLNGKESFMVPTLQFVFSGKLVPNAPDDMYAALGKNGQILSIVPSEKLIVVRMGDTPGEDEVTVQLTDTIWQKLNDVICTADVIESFTLQNRITVYPNPVHDVLVVHDILPEKKQIQIFNAMGEILFTDFFTSELEIPFTPFAPGMYFIAISSDEERLTLRVVNTRDL